MPTGWNSCVQYMPVFLPDGTYETREDRAQVAVHVYEIDGWVGHVDDALNMYKMKGSRNEGAIYEVLYTRFVDIEEEA